ncbi:DeoR/GlpR transcriptional regulator [Serratia sp. S1B]|nr:DeoR/GlpR transcriptional regulator [Serratia sp. S1B]
MLQVERHILIFNHIQKNGFAQVKELSNIFNVSLETIRRDLATLAENKKIVRSFGGAALLEHNAFALEVDHPTGLKHFVDKAESFLKRTHEGTDFKTKIAKAALQFIKENDCIMMDNSTTCWFIARQMPDIDITVITNSLNIVQTLACRKKVRIISVGGEYSERHGDFHGPVAELTIKSFKVSKFFFSCQGIDSEYAIRDGSELNVRLKQEMLKVTDKKILLADSRKFDQHSIYKICNLSDIDVLITNKLPAEKYRCERIETIETD